MLPTYRQQQSTGAEVIGARGAHKIDEHRDGRQRREHDEEPATKTSAPCKAKRSWILGTTETIGKAQPADAQALLD
jgi:hypothetical protein